MNAEQYTLELLFNSKEDFNLVIDNFVKEDRLLLSKLISPPSPTDMRFRMKRWGCFSEPIITRADEKDMVMEMDVMGGEPANAMVTLSTLLNYPLDMNYYNLLSRIAGVMTFDGGEIISRYFTNNWGGEVKDV